MASWVQEFVGFLATDFFMSDQFLATFVPVLVFWVYSGIYMFLGTFEKYRLHPRKDEDLKNLVSKSQVIKGVLLHQGIQSVLAILILKESKENGAIGASTATPSLIVISRQFLVAMLVADTWLYFTHRLMHHNKFLYRHVHSVHHKLYVPYAFGGLYNHPVETIVDMIGAGMAFFASGMTPWTSMFFFSFNTMKVIDDHCGLWLPGNIFHVFFANNTAYHDTHHQLYGNKHNFSQPFFVLWDKIMGTYMPCRVEKREGGGYMVKPAKED